ncbi:MAG: type II toxin-antitoxin system PemK/MazF family toxin [Streptosporangiaceae bacterium]
MKRVEPWQAWWVDFSPQVGTEQAGRRLAVVVASAFHCRFPIPLTIVLPMTTRERALPHRVPVTLPGKETSWVITEQPHTIDHGRIVGDHPIVTLTDDEIAAVRYALAKMIDI